MKRLLAFIVPFALLVPFSTAQTTSKDSSDFPYWVDMMADPTVNFFQTQRAFNTYWKDRKIEKGSGYKPFKRWEYNMSQIIDGKGNIPAPGSLELEVEKYLKQRSTPSGGSGFGTLSIGGAIGSGSATCQVSGNWIELGPGYLPGNRTGQPNGIGRINGIAFHPTDSNVIYAGAPAGGVWITKDGGQTWSTNTDSLATLGVSSIAVDPQNPDTIYLGTGDRDASDSYGRGVFKSMDGGQTWVQTNSGMGNTTVGKILIDPTNTSTLLAATSGGIYRSTNYGASWTRTETGNFKDLTFDAGNTQYVYACRTGAQFYRSTDNGANWTKVSSGLPSSKARMAVAVTPNDANFVYVVVTNSKTFEGLYLSTDKGATFSQMSNSPNIMDYSHLGTGTGGQAWYDLDIAVHPDDKTLVTVCGVNIFQSSDSGKTWKINAHWVGSGGAPAVHADNHVMEYQPNTKTLYAGNDGGVYYTKDLGKSWEDISEGLGIAQIYRLGQSATLQNTLINGYQDNGTGLYENAKWYTVVGGDGMDCAIDPTDANYAYSALYYGDIRRMVNGYSTGTIAKNGKNGITESGGWVTPYVLREGTPSTMFVGYKNIWRSTDIKAASVNSVTWTKISNNVAGSNTKNITALENSPANSNILYVSRSGNKFFKSTNVNAATPTWTDLTSNLPNNSSVLWIESHPKKDYRLWICQSNKVYQSDNGGTSWTNISNGLPNIPMISLVFDSSSKKQGMYVGTYMGVFYKDTTMSSWIWYNDNMPINTRVRDIEIYYSPKGRSQSHVVCATYGRGNWRSPLYDEDQDVPVAGFTSPSKHICQNTSVKFNDTSLNLPTVWLWRFTPNTVTYLNGTDSCSQHPEVRFNTQGAYSVKMYAENCAGYDSAEVTNIIQVHPPITAASCTPITTNKTSSAGLGIYGVQLDQYNVVSGNTKSDGEYIDMACTEVFELKSDTFYITDITTGPSYSEYVKIYIDFNNNGNLDDTGELVYDTYNKTDHKDTIKIPASAKTNTLLRMRVMSDFNPITHSCDTLGYGQTEDYGVILDASIPTPHFLVDTNRICQNESITLTDSSIGLVTNRKWYVSKYGSLTFKSNLDGPVNFNLPDTGWYYAELVLNDSIVSKRIDSIVYVKPLPSAGLAIVGGSNKACQGESIVLKNTTDFKSGTFAWYKDNVQLPILDDSVITLGNIVIADSGNYHSTLTFDGCESASMPVKVNVYPLPSAIFTTANQDSCETTNTIDFVNNSNILYGSLSYSWDFGDGNTSSSSAPSRIYGDTGQYTVTLIATSTENCADTVSNQVNIWSSTTALFSVNTLNQCFVGNAFNFTNSSTIEVGSLTYNWDFGNGNTSTASNPTETYNSVGNFDVQLIVTSSNNCFDTIMQQVTTSPNPVAAFDIQNMDSCLDGNTFDFVNQSSITNGSITVNAWEMGDGSNSSTVDNIGFSYKNTGNYAIRLIVRSDQGCEDTLSKSVNIYPSPMLDFSVNSDIQCLTDNSFTFNDLSSVSKGLLTDFAWDFGDGNASMQRNPLPHSYSTEGNYIITLTVTSDNNCVETITKNVTVNPTPEISFTGAIECVDEEIPFSNFSIISTGSIAAYKWSFGDGNTSTEISPTHIYTKPGTYEVKLVATSDLGCKDSISIQTGAVINPKPISDFSYEKVGSFENQTEVVFTENSIDGDTWTWWIDGLAQGIGSPYQHTFQDTGSFEIVLYTSNSFGCNDSISKLLFIVPDADLKVPTSFSPNNDNLNDLFKPYGVDFVKEYKLSIYNRWGNLIFASSNPNVGWDGSVAGLQALPGQYLVLVEVIDFNNEKKKYTGMLSLVR